MSNEKNLPPAPVGGNAAPASQARPSAAFDSVGPHDDAQLPGGRVDGGAPGGRPEMNFDDDEIYSGRGNGAATGGTADAPASDAAPLGAPSAGLSDRNGPSDRKDVEQGRK